MNANPPGYGKVLKRDSLRPVYPLSPLAGCPNFRIPTAYYSVISAKLSTLSARSKSTSEIPMYSKPLRSLRKWGTNVYGLSNSPVFKKPSTELILPPSNRYTMYCLWLSVTFKTDSPTKLDQQLMAEDEQLFQQLWRTYFKTIAIKERINPKLHRQNLPVRFWKYLTEK